MQCNSAKPGGAPAKGVCCLCDCSFVFVSVCLDVCSLLRTQTGLLVSCFVCFVAGGLSLLISVRCVVFLCSRVSNFACDWLLGVAAASPAGAAPAKATDDSGTVVLLVFRS